MILAACAKDLQVLVSRKRLSSIACARSVSMLAMLHVRQLEENATD